MQQLKHKPIIADPLTQISPMTPAPGGALHQTAAITNMPGASSDFPQGMTALPTGQVINVAVNSANPNLSFKEWAARGVVAGIGKMLAFPFRLAGLAAERVVEAIVAIIKWGLIIILVPTLIWAGYQLQQKISTSGSTEAGAAAIVHEGRNALSGIGKGVSDDQPKPTPKN